jgi:signal transduction histidine kinase
MASETIDILLVDDEARNLDALESILSDPTYRLLRAQDADTALKLLLENDAAAIVLDIRMPGVSGLELARLIKGTKRFRQIPILFLTAHMVEDKDVLAGYDAGAVDYLTKPVEPLVLKYKVALFADLFRKTRALAELNGSLERRVQERTAELAKSEAALREASQQKDRFIATLAHELRNPLAPLRTGLDVILRHPERPVALEGMLAAMNRQLDHIVRLVDDLLDLARITRGTLQLRRETVEVPLLVDRAIEMTSPFLARRSQSVAFDNAEVSLRAHVDPMRIAQILGNLLSNASKHSPSGSRVAIRLREEASGATIQVVDAGVGIPRDELRRVFDMFTKIERPTEAPNDGLGIGLALSKHLAELHGGTLTAESEGEGKGATFTLTFPTTGAAAAVDASLASERDRHASARVKLRVVVIEDHDDSADMLCAWLKMLGHDPMVARTGPEGLTLVKRASPDVVLGFDPMVMAPSLGAWGRLRPQQPRFSRRSYASSVPTFSPWVPTVSEATVWHWTVFPPRTVFVVAASDARMASAALGALVAVRPAREHDHRPTARRGRRFDGASRMPSMWQSGCTTVGPARRGAGPFVPGDSAVPLRRLRQSLSRLVQGVAAAATHLDSIVALFDHRQDRREAERLTPFLCCRAARSAGIPFRACTARFPWINCATADVAAVKGRRSSGAGARCIPRSERDWSPAPAWALLSTSRGEGRSECIRAACPRPAR